MTIYLISFTVWLIVSTVSPKKLDFYSSKSYKHTQLTPPVFWTDASLSCSHPSTRLTQVLIAPSEAKPHRNLLHTSPKHTPKEHTVYVFRSLHYAFLKLGRSLNPRNYILCIIELLVDSSHSIVQSFCCLWQIFFFKVRGRGLTWGGDKGKSSNESHEIGSLYLREMRWEAMPPLHHPNLNCLGQIISVCCAFFYFSC